MQFFDATLVARKGTQRSFKASRVLALLFWMAILYSPYLCAQPMPHLDNPAQRLYLKADRHYRAGYFDLALYNFRKSAAWGNKISQYNVGTMYYNGIGVEPDLAVAWAWFELAAERDYSVMVQTAKETYRELSKEQKRRAKAILEEELWPRYSDEVTLPRLDRHLDRHRRSATGSRLGGPGSSPVVIYGANGHIGLGDTFYDQSNWSASEFVAREKALVRAMTRGRVQLRDLDSEAKDDTR